MKPTQKVTLSATVINTFQFQIVLSSKQSSKEFPLSTANTSSV